MLVAVLNKINFTEDSKMKIQETVNEGESVAVWGDRSPTSAWNYIAVWTQSAAEKSMELGVRFVVLILTTGFFSVRRR